NEEHRLQWRNSVARYVVPILGDLPVDAIGTAEVVAVIEPIWREKASTADRVRNRIESVLDFAASRAYRPAGDNPARWRGHLEHSFTRAVKVHMDAMPWADVPAYWPALAGRADPASRALALVVLTAARADQV